MRNWIFAAVIGLATCGQAFAWDDEEEPILYGGRYNSMAEWQRAKRAEQDIELYRNQQRLNEGQMLMNQEESLANQREMLKIEKRRLELEEERERDRKLGY